MSSVSPASDDFAGGKRVRPPMRYSSLIPTTLPAMPVPTTRLRFILLPCMLALAACSTQVELRMAQQQEQWANEAARQGHWPQALRTYEEAIDNVELGHGDTSWQARLHQQAAQAAGAACRPDALEHHVRSAAALWRRAGVAAAPAPPSMEQSCGARP